VLGHHFPTLLDPFLRHAYFESAYFHAIVDAIIPLDGETICEPVHQYDDALFAQVGSIAPNCVLLCLIATNCA
jgi:hypothetical protein